MGGETRASLLANQGKAKQKPSHDTTGLTDGAFKNFKTGRERKKNPGETGAQARALKVRLTKLKKTGTGLRWGGSTSERVRPANWV